MGHERIGITDEWYTPKYIFDAMDTFFNLDVAPAQYGESFVPALRFLRDGLSDPWKGFVWMNPPFGKRNGLIPWLDKFIEHGNGIALTPDRTSAPWWQHIAKNTDAILFISPKVKFISPDGKRGKQPSNGTTLFAIGTRGVNALKSARSLGFLTLSHT